MALLNLDRELRELRKIFEEEKAKTEAVELPELSTEQQMMLREFRKLELAEAGPRAKSLPMELVMYLTLDGLKEVAKCPYHFSDLPHWLEYETWKPKDALLLLAGVSPEAAIVDWTYENFIGATVNKPKIRAATPLDSIHDIYDVPERDAWDDDIKACKQRLKEKDLAPTERIQLEDDLKSLEKLRDGEEVVRREKILSHRSEILSALSRRWFSGAHDVEARSPPDHFISWAMARGFQPEWYEWANEIGLVETPDEVYRAPFFDPDASDYPELLHIAVRAWDAVRVGGNGTPKQRIERWLADRYPHLKPTTREVIAQVANWERTGGRPPRP